MICWLVRIAGSQPWDYTNPVLHEKAMWATISPTSVHTAMYKNNNRYLEHLICTGPKLLHICLMDMFSRFYAYDPPPPTHTHTHSCVSGQWDWIKCFWKEKGFQGRFKRTDKRQNDGQKQGVGSRYLKPGNIYMLHAVLQTDPVRSQEMGRGNYT